MPITINTNVASLNAQRRLSVSTGSLRKTYEQLSSGLRITRASDDAAGLAIADSLKLIRPKAQRQQPRLRHWADNRQRK